LGLRVAPVGVIKEREDKYRVIHDLSTEQVGIASVNATTDFDDAPPCGCGKVLAALLLRIWQLRQKWPTKRIMISKMDVTAAFRQLRLNTDGVLIGYVYEDLVIIDLRLQFRWRSSPGWWELVNTALMWSHAQNSMQSMPELLPAAVAVRERMTIEPDSGVDLTAVRVDTLARQQLQGGGPNDKYFAVMYVDDSIPVEVHWSDERCLAATASLANDHYKMLGEPSNGEPGILSAKKLVAWSTCILALGWEINTNTMEITLPKDKVKKTDLTTI
jgi:hypothetical protein